MRERLVQLALKIDVDTLRGTREGVPALVDALKRAEADATFLFSLGPDHTGRALRRVFRRGCSISHPRCRAPRCSSTTGCARCCMAPCCRARISDAAPATSCAAVRDAGYEVGVHCFDHTTWQDFVSRRGEAWTRDQMLRAVHRFREVFGVKPQVHGAAGWQMNESALELEEEMGFLYASDTRGETPFVPLLSPPAPQPQRRSACPQLPTTLPTLDELLGVDGTTVDNVHQALLERTRARRASHVFTLHAELEGMKLLPVLRRLIQGWHGQGYQLVSMRTLFAGLNLDSLPAGRVQSGSVPGRSGVLAVQGPPGL